MLMSQFIGLNVYFAANLLAALVSFGVFWLIYDAWTNRHPGREVFKWAGFLAVSLGFLLRATAIQSGGSTQGFAHLAAYVADILRMLGYLSIVIGQFVDPLQPRPVYQDDALAKIAGQPVV